MTEPLPWVQQPGPSTWGSGPSGSRPSGPSGPVSGPDGRPDVQVSTLPLALGGLGIVLFPFLGGLLLGLPALVVGLRRRRRAQRLGGSDGRATAGAVLGGLSLVATVLFTTYVVTSPAFRDYVSCVRAAVDDAEVDRCETALRERVSGG